jgi:hypothetical protein
MSTVQEPTIEINKPGNWGFWQLRVVATLLPWAILSYFVAQFVCSFHISANAAEREAIKAGLLRFVNAIGGTSAISRYWARRSLLGPGGQWEGRVGPIALTVMAVDVMCGAMFPGLQFKISASLFNSVFPVPLILAIAGLLIFLGVFLSPSLRPPSISSGPKDKVMTGEGHSHDAVAKATSKPGSMS